MRVMVFNFISLMLKRKMNKLAFKIRAKLESSEHRISP